MNANGTLTLIDTSNYPGGVPVLVKGCFTVITEPDGISVGNSNFSAPDIQWGGSGLNPANYELRLNTAGSFQTGGYLITYQVQAAGYNPTILTKTFNLAYQRPTPVILPNFDNFTPNLSVSDGTNYTQSGFNLVSLNQTWSALIDSVNGTNQTIGGTGSTFSLAYGGVLYDANYSVSLSSVVTWTLAANPWVTLIDTITLAAQSFDAETPPSMVTLLSYATFMLAQLNAAICDCNTYPTYLANYLLYMSIYTHLGDRGCNSDFAGLSAYVYQLQAIANNNITPPVAHTDLPIPAYDFNCGGGGGGSTAWTAITGKPATVIIQWTVGTTGSTIPNNAGQNSITDARLEGFNVLILRNYAQELNYTKTLGSGTITFGNSFTQGEVIYIQSIPL